MREIILKLIDKIFSEGFAIFFLILCAGVGFFVLLLMTGPHR